MIRLHANWASDRLHLWAEDRRAPEKQQNSAGSTPHEGIGRWRSALGAEELRRVCGDLWDSLLISEATEEQLQLSLPTLDVDRRPMPGNESAVATTARTQQSLTNVLVPTLAFAPSDGVDLLTSVPSAADPEVQRGASLLFWSKVAELVMELLARQSIVPALHELEESRYLGYWRLVIEDAPTLRRIHSLIASMPPICRSHSDRPEPAWLMESFLWRSTDALVRRCLEGDELVHLVRQIDGEAPSNPVRWLRSLIGAEAALIGTEEQCAEVYQAVSTWVNRLKPPVSDRAYRTCIQLHAPSVDAATGLEELEPAPWWLTFHVESAAEPGVWLDAAHLEEPCSNLPPTLPRMSEGALPQLRTDLANAARRFAPLEPCARADGLLECRLSTVEAYTFLRDAVPALELDGCHVIVPAWWQERIPRLRLRLGIRPAAGQANLDATSLSLDALVAFDWHLVLDDQELSPHEVRHVMQWREPLARIRGQWIRTQHSDLQIAAAFLEKQREGTATLWEVLRKCLSVEDHETGLAVSGIRAHGWVDLLLNGPDRGIAMEELPAPSGFVGTLRPYQLTGFRWLAFAARIGLGCCLADDMGLGKTIQLIALLLHEKALGHSRGPTLLVVPMSLVGNWRREMQRFAPSLRVMVHHGTERLSGRQFADEAVRHDVVVSTYGLTHRDFAHLAAVPWGRISLDEAQNIKNPAGKQAAAIRSLRTPHRVALTGTPVENRLGDLWAIMEFMNPGFLGSAQEFRHRFALPIERQRDADRAGRLRQLIRPFVLRRLKSDPAVQLDLPRKMEMTVFCNLTREQALLYENLVREMLARIDASEGIQRRGLVLATLVRLKQICNHPAHFLRDDGVLSHRSGKCDRLTGMLEEVIAEEDKAIIFTQYRQMGELLKKHLEATFQRPVLFLHGGTPRQTRDAMVAQFQGDTRDSALFILSLKAGGFGLNLTAASHVFHFDRWWNPAVEDQATDRAHRIGQTQRVQVHKFVCLGTLEERIDALLESKRNLADNVVGTGEAWITELSTKALRDLFALSREAVMDEEP